MLRFSSFTLSSVNGIRFSKLKCVSCYQKGVRSLFDVKQRGFSCLSPTKVGGVSTFHIDSPLILSQPLSRLLNSNVYLKLDALQPTGCFKIRGVGYECSKAVHERKCNHLISSSGGNAGLAAAFAARKLNVKCTVYVPSTTPQFMREKIANENANVIVHGDVWDEANEEASRVAGKDSNSAFIYPFDHEDVWKGNSTMIEEIYDTFSSHKLKKPSGIVCVVGGGGMLAGVVQGLQKVGWNDVPVFTSETEGAASFALSVRANKLLKLKSIESIAKSLGALEVCKKAFESAQLHPITPLIVSDLMAVEAIWKFSEDHKILVEPACAAGLALAYNRNPSLISSLSNENSSESQLSNLVIIVCGGSMISPSIMENWKTEFGI